jgi:hypothetical protein
VKIQLDGTWPGSPDAPDLDHKLSQALTLADQLDRPG